MSIQGQARPARGANALQQLGAVLEPLNKSIGQFMNNRSGRAEIEANQYYSEMEAAMRDGSYDIQSALKKAGFSQWDNPYIYRNQLINLAGNEAYKDADRLQGNAEFIKEVFALKNTTSFEDYEQALIGVAEKHRLNFSKPKNEKVGAYWDVGYVPKWLEARRKLIAPHLADKKKAQQVEIRQTFYESGRNALLNSITNYGAVDPATGKPHGITEFKKFISDQWATQAGHDHSLNGAVFKEMVMPVFKTLIDQQPHRLDELGKVFEEVVGMTRLTKEGSRVSMFNRIDDTENGTYEFWGEREAASAKAYAFQTKAREDAFNRTKKMLVSDINNWPDIPELAALDVSWPPRDGAEIRKIALALQKTNRYSGLHLAEDKLHNDNTFRDLVQLATDSVTETKKTRYKNEGDFEDELLLHMSRQLEDFQTEADLPYWDEVQNMFRDALKGSESLPDAIKRAENLLETKDFLEGFRKQNPTFTEEGIKIETAITHFLWEEAAGLGVEETKTLIQIANNLSTGKLTDDMKGWHSPTSILEQLREIQSESFPGELDVELGRAMVLLEEHMAVEDQFEAFAANAENLVVEAINGSGNAVMMNEVIPANLYKSDKLNAKITGINISTNTVTTSQRKAATLTMEMVLRDAHKFARGELAKYQRQHPNKEERDVHFEEQGEEAINTKVRNYVRDRATIYASRYNDHVRQDSEEQEEFKRKTINTLPAQLRQTEMEQQADEEALQELIVAPGSPNGPTPAQQPGEEEPAEPSSAGDIARSRRASAYSKPQQPTTNKQYRDRESSASTSSAAEYFTGEAGLDRWSKLEKVQEIRETQTQELIADTLAAQYEYDAAKEVGDISKMAGAKKDIKAKQDSLRAMILLNDALPWKTFVENGKIKPTLVLPLESGGQTYELPFDVKDIRFNNHLMINNWGGFQEIEDVVDKWEEAMIGATKEPSDDSGEKSDESPAPSVNPDDLLTDEVKGMAALFEKSSGHNILHPGDSSEDRRIRRNAHTAWANMAHKQLGMFMARKPSDMPNGVRGAIAMNLTEAFLKNDEVNSYQDVYFSPSDKDFISGIAVHNKNIINGMVNLEDGVTRKRFWGMYGMLTGGKATASLYELDTGMGLSVGQLRTKPDTIFKRQFIYTLPDEPESTEGAVGRATEASVRMTGIGDEDVRNRAANVYPLGHAAHAAAGDILIYGRIDAMLSRFLPDWLWGTEGVKDVHTTRMESVGLTSRRGIVAQEMALAASGVNHPTQMDKAQAVDGAAYSKNLAKYTMIMDSGSPQELAHAWNMLLSRSGLTEQVTGRLRDQPNPFAIVPLSIPHKPKK